MTTNEKVTFLARKRGWSYGQIAAMLNIVEGAAGIRALLVAGQNVNLTETPPADAADRQRRVIALKRRWLANADIANLLDLPLDGVTAFLRDPTQDPAGVGIN
jgi:hypothetical protein